MNTENTIKKWTINDYYTPAVKAEVILDMLLSPYIAEVVADQLGDQIHGKLRLVTKEMSISNDQKDSDLGSKIDYILSDDVNVYLVELKTSNDSIKGEQAKRYVTNCLADKGKGDPETFGSVLGKQLVRILWKKMDLGGEKLNADAPIYSVVDFCEKGDDGLQALFEEIWDMQSKPRRNRGKGPAPARDKSRSAQQEALDLIRYKSWTSTSKYFYTLGQILDYLNENEQSNGLWEKPLRLIYVTPDGRHPYPEIKTQKKPAGREETYKSFEKLYVHPDGADSVSLRKAASFLSKKDGEYAACLADILGAIFGSPDN